MGAYHSKEGVGYAGIIIMAIIFIVNKNFFASGPAVRDFRAVRNQRRKGGTE
jgi:hypothetical protein